MSEVTGNPAPRLPANEQTHARPPSAVKAAAGNGVVGDDAVPAAMLEAAAAAGLKIGSPAEEYLIDKPIGKGKFATVFRATRKADGVVVALKEIAIDAIDDKARDKCLKEVRLMRSLDHPNVIKLLDGYLFIAPHNHNPPAAAAPPSAPPPAAEQPPTADGAPPPAAAAPPPASGIGSGGGKKLVLVFDYAEAGDLKRQIRKAREREARLHERIVWKYFSEIAEAVQHLHSKRIMHRDLKPANILLQLSGQVKVGDLGLGRALSEDTLAVQSRVGTPLYMSPEVLKGNGYDFASDVWSLGCILYELAMLRSPFKEENLTLFQLFEKITKGSYPPVSEVYSPELRSLVDRMLQQEPASRPDINEVARLAGEMRDVTAKARAAQMQAQAQQQQAQQVQQPVQPAGEVTSASTTAAATPVPSLSAPAGAAAAGAGNAVAVITSAAPSAPPSAAAGDHIPTGTASARVPLHIDTAATAGPPSTTTATTAAQQGPLPQATVTAGSAGSAGSAASNMASKPVLFSPNLQPFTPTFQASGGSGGSGNAGNNNIIGSNVHNTPSNAGNGNAGGYGSAPLATPDMSVPMATIMATAAAVQQQQQQRLAGGGGSGRDSGVADGKRGDGGSSASNASSGTVETGATGAGVVLKRPPSASASSGRRPISGSNKPPRWSGASPPPAQGQGQGLGGQQQLSRHGSFVSNDGDGVDGGGGSNYYGDGASFDAQPAAAPSPAAAIAIAHKPSFFASSDDQRRHARPTSGNTAQSAPPSAPASAPPSRGSDQQHQQAPHQQQQQQQRPYSASQQHHSHPHPAAALSIEAAMAISESSEVMAGAGLLGDVLTLLADSESLSGSVMGALRRNKAVSGIMAVVEEDRGIMQRKAREPLPFSAFSSSPATAPASFVAAVRILRWLMVAGAHCGPIAASSPLQAAAQRLMAAIASQASAKGALPIFADVLGSNLTTPENRAAGASIVLKILRSALAASPAPVDDGSGAAGAHSSLQALLSGDGAVSATSLAEGFGQSVVRLLVWASFACLAAIGWAASPMSSARNGEDEEDGDDLDLLEEPPAAPGQEQDNEDVDVISEARPVEPHHARHDRHHRHLGDDNDGLDSDGKQQDGNDDEAAHAILGGAASLPMMQAPSAAVSGLWTAEHGRLKIKLGTVDEALASMLAGRSAASLAQRDDPFPLAPDASPNSAAYVLAEAVQASGATFAAWRGRLAGVKSSAAHVGSYCDPESSGNSAFHRLLSSLADACQRDLETVSHGERRWNTAPGGTSSGGDSIQSLAAEYREVANAQSDLAFKLQDGQEKLASVSSALNSTSEALEACQELITSKSDDLSGTSRLQKLRTALADLRKQKQALDVEVGLLSNAVMKVATMKGAEALALARPNNKMNNQGASSGLGSPTRGGYGGQRRGLLADLLASNTNMSKRGNGLGGTGSDDEDDDEDGDENDRLGESSTGM